MKNNQYSLLSKTGGRCACTTLRRGNTVKGALSVEELNQPIARWQRDKARQSDQEKVKRKLPKQKHCL